MTISDALTLPQALADASRTDAAITLHGGRGKPSLRLPWRDLAGEAEIWGRRLYRAGLVPGDRVGLPAETDALFITLFLACQVAGLVPVPLPVAGPFADRDAHAERIGAMLATAGARLAVLPETLRLGTPPDQLTPAEIGALPEQPRDFPSIGPDDLGFIQFSSGSTRFPKGVMVPQRALVANARAIAGPGLGIGPGDMCVSWLPLYHDMGLVGCLLAPLVSRTPMHLLPTPEFVRNPMLWLRLMAETGGTVTYSPAFGYDLATRRMTPEAAAGLDLARWRVAGVGGDMVRPDVLARFAEAARPAGFDPRAFVVSYGLAEATLAVTMPGPGRGLSVDRVDADRLEREGLAVPAGPERSRVLAMCGRPLPGTELAIVDSDGNRLPERRVGRVKVRGPSVMAGYFGDAGETARVLSPDGWLETGDLGYLAEGELVVTGRSKDLIIVNGRNVWPHDLEWLAERVSPLRPGDVAAVAGLAEDGAEQAVLLVQCRASDDADRAWLAEAVGASVLAVTGVLCKVVLVPPHALPRTSSGKLARAQARRLLAEGRFG